MPTDTARPATKKSFLRGSAAFFDSRADASARQVMLTILSTTLMWCAFAALIRGRLVFMRHDLNLALPIRLIATAYYDLVIAIPAAAVSLGFAYLARHSARRLRLIARLWWSFAGLMVVLDAVNVVVLRFLGTPFTYQWLYYSDFLGSLEARNAIGDALSWPLIGGLAAFLAIFVACAALLRAVLAYALARGILRHRPFGFAMALAGLSCLLLARFGLDHNSWSYSKIANPVVAFLGSFAAQDVPPIFTMVTPAGTSDFQTAAERSHGKSSMSRLAAGTGAGAKVRNLLVFVFESLPAEYVDVYGSPYHATPELTRLRGQSLVFTHAYAHTPATNVSLVSILTGTYPWISSRFVTEEYPALPVHSMSAAMKRNGARTAFFNSADLRFKGADKFLERHDFDELFDDRSIPCDKPLNRAGSKGTLLSPAWEGDGVDDGCMADAVIRWIQHDPSRPFFAMTWTMMTHFPYFAGRSEMDYGTDDARLNRYLNGLHAGDAALGKIVRTLDELGVLDSTLIVALGDHGEAFGRHGQYVHASKIYEENVHIPLLLVNRHLFGGEESSAIAGLADIAPTVIDLMGLPQPGDWQGRSLLEQDRPPRTYFFAPWADLLFGYREGDRKYIFNASNGQYEAYDLASDPQETRNLIDQLPGERQRVLERIAAWVQYQNRMIGKLVASGDVVN